MDAIATSQLNRMLLDNPAAIMAAIDNPKSAPGLAKLIGTMDESKQLTLYRSARTEVRYAQAEIKEKQREQEQLARETATRARSMVADELDRIGQTGRPLNLQRIHGALAAVDPQEAAGLLRKADIFEDSYHVQKEATALPLPERAAFIEENLKPKHNDKDYRLRRQVYEQAMGHAAAQVKAELQDPAAAVFGYAQKAMDAAKAEGTLDGNNNADMQRFLDAAILQEQKRLGFPPSARRLLSNHAKTEIKQKFNSATATEKTELIYTLQKTHGQYFSQVLQELELPAELAFAAGVSSDPQLMPLAERLMDAATRKEADYQILDEAKINIKRDVASIFADSDFGEFLNARAVLAGSDGRHAQHRNGVQTLVAKLAMGYVQNGLDHSEAIERAMGQISGKFPTLVDEDLAICRLPDGVSQSQAAIALEASRAMIPDEYFSRYPYPEQTAAAARETGVWVDDGEDGYVLVDQRGYAYVTPDGEKFRKTWAEIKATLADELRRIKQRGESAEESIKGWGM